MRAWIVVIAGFAALITVPPAPAVGAPEVAASWVTNVTATSARLHAEIDPNGISTVYRFEYISVAASEANVGAGKDPFANASRVPAGADAPLGGGTAPIAVSQTVSQLSPSTPYRYRARAQSTAGTAFGPVLGFVTQGLGGGPLLLDGRGWEMVSPVDKNGGAIPGVPSGGLMQAAAGGGSITYSSTTSFPGSAEGAPPLSQYLSRRGSASWTTDNVSPPLLAGSYGDQPDASPYRLFSSQLDDGLLLNGERCRGGVGECPVSNPPLAGTDAPAGYKNYYMRHFAGGGGFEALLGPDELQNTALAPTQFELRVVGGSADLGSVVLSTCAALTADAVEAAGPGGCDPPAQNLYRWSAGELSLVNVLPGQSLGEPGALLAAPIGAVSADGTRVYWTDGSGLYLREGKTTAQVDASVGGGAVFQATAADGAIAFFIKAGHLYRYDAGGGSATDLTPGAGVIGFLGSSEDGSRYYYATESGVFLGAGSEPIPVAAAADSGNYPPWTGAARVTSDGEELAFLSSASLTGYDNIAQGSGVPTSQVYLFDAVAGSLTCASCNPTGARPLGDSTIPGSAGPDGFYRPRSLSADGERLFFESEDALVLADTNGSVDVYEWEAQGSGSCAQPSGCIGLISGGKASAGASFVDASLNGDDAFFLTVASLAPADPGAVDLYDARVGGGFPTAPTPIACQGDACQSLPSEPEETVVNTLIPGPGNPAVRYPKRARGKVKRHRGRGHCKRGARRRKCPRQGKGKGSRTARASAPEAQR